MPAQATEQDILSILRDSFQHDRTAALDAYEEALERFPELETQQIASRYCR